MVGRTQSRGVDSSRGNTCRGGNTAASCTQLFRRLHRATAAAITMAAVCGHDSLHWARDSRHGSSGLALAESTESMHIRGSAENNRRIGTRSTEEVDGLPRILTVLTTYEARSSFIKSYKEAATSRWDGYEPEIFVVSNQDDPDEDHVIDFKIGTPRNHRLLAAIMEACARYQGQFDWLALGDDDTVFMYKRAQSFLRHMDPSLPIAIGRVDGLNGNSSPVYKRPCYTPEEKANHSDPVSSTGCCYDFSHPCPVSIYPEFPEIGTQYSYEDYGPYGLFWPFGGMGTFVSHGLAVEVVGGFGGWARCAQVFGYMNTDVQFGQCMRTHGYTMGSYAGGFMQVETSNAHHIGLMATENCEAFGIHLGVRHLTDGEDYTPETFGLAVAALRDQDELWTGAEDELEKMCPQSWEALNRYK